MKIFYAQVQKRIKKKKNDKQVGKKKDKSVIK